MWIKRHIVLFCGYKLSNMGIQGNENSFFAWDLKVATDQFFWNLEFAPDCCISHYLVLIRDRLKKKKSSRHQKQDCAIIQLKHVKLDWK